MNKYNDPRVSVKSMRFRNYIVLFLSILLVCGGYTYIYYKQRSIVTVYTILSILTFLAFVSILLVILFEFFRQHYFLKPVQRLSDSARKVAQGDYTVRILPFRKDGKKDEFEVLFDDFNSMVKELASTEMLKKDFVSNVSHELKTPLAVIQNYAALIENTELTEQERLEYIKKIVEVSKRMSTMITNILQISRLENQIIPIKSKKMNLSEQLCRCALEFESIWEEKEIILETDLDQNLIIDGDEELLDIVWNNLISNALKFTDKGGKVRISTINHNDTICVIVEDTGCGIDENDLRHIFDKFYQADTSHATKGNGLGLAMVKRILDLQGGSITVESTPGLGSIFIITLF